MPVVKTFNVQIRVNKTFLPGYTNLISSESLTFIHNFTARTEDVFRARLSHFKQIEVKSLSNGIVLVDFDVEVYSLSNASTIAVERALEDANSTGSLGYQLPDSSLLSSSSSSFSSSSSYYYYYYYYYYHYYLCYYFFYF